jgi:hypothetical protein
MKLEHYFGEELGSNIPEASICSRSCSLRLLALRIQQDWTQTSFFGISIRNSTECESRFYSQTKRIFSEVISVVEGLLQEVYVQRSNTSSVIMKVALRAFLATPYISVPVHFSMRVY